ncbi:19514_t:CDS:1, partial [Dentiscutata erythropus]
CNVIIAENDDYGSTATINQDLIIGKDISFMPCNIEEYNEYINNTPYYVLQLYSYLVNGQKVVVTFSGIKVFFDIRVSDNQNIDIFETEIKNIIANGKDGEGGTVDMTELQTEHIKAFPIRGYYKEKKPYVRIITTTSKQRSIALNIILKYNSEITSSDIDKSKLETASDDLSAYYRKVAREYRIPLSRWILLTNYKYAKHRVSDSYNSHRMPYSARSPLCEHAFYLSVNNFCHVEDPA